MRINEIMIDGFGKHVNLHLDFEAGVNVLYGENESGKSTVVAFIRAALYGMSGRGVMSDRKKYAPWNESAKYGGWMKFEHAGNYYRVVVRFAESKRGDSVALYNDMTGRQIPIPEGQTVGEMILEMSPATYDITVYAPQLGSKPELDNANMDYLIEQLSKSSNREMNQSETAVSKRLKQAMDYISAPRSGKGIIDVARVQKAKIDEDIAVVEKYEDDIQQMRDLHKLKTTQLNKLKEDQSKTNTAYDSMRAAVDTLAKHDKIRRVLTSVNVLDESIFEEGRRQRRYKIPMYIFLALVFLLAVGVAALVFLKEYATKISFIGELEIYKMLVSHSKITYISVAAVLAVLVVIYLITMFSGSKEMRNLNRDLQKEEDNLAELLDLKFHEEDTFEYRNSAVKQALEVQEEDFNRAKDFMDNLERKSREDEIYHIKVEQLTQEISYAKAAIDSLLRQINAYEEYETLVMQSKALDEKIQNLQRKYDALSLARTALAESFEKWQSDLGPVFAGTAQSLLYDITNGRHENMKIDRDFEISLPDENTGKLYPSGYFSGATIDQMYLALRLALVKLVSSETSVLPVIFDDPFVQYDIVRKGLAMTALSDFADRNDSQVIITTCLRDMYPDDVNVIELK